MPSRVELVAHNRDTDSIAEAIGADLVIFQTLPNLISAVRQFNPSIKTFDCSVFNGEYVTGGVDGAYLQHLENLRADNVKNAVQMGGVGVMEGKGGGGLKRNGGVGNGTMNNVERSLGCSGPMNGADDTIGLHNNWTGAR